MIYIRDIILVGFFGGLLLMIRTFLSDLPKNLREIKMENIKNQNSKKLQIDSFYRQTSNEKLMQTLSSWIEVIYDIEGFIEKEPEHFIEMLSNVVLHGSDKSLIKMADFQQYTYKLDAGEFKDFTIEERGLIGIYLASFVVTQLKEDFTGYEIDSEQLLRAKLSDYESKTTMLEKCKQEAMKHSTIKDTSES